MQQSEIPNGFYRVIIFIAAFFFSFIFQVFAQPSDGSVPPETLPRDPVVTPEEPAGGITTPPVPTPTPSPAAPSPSTKPVAAPKIPVKEAPLINTVLNAPPLSPSSEEAKNVIIASLAAVGAAVLLFLGLNMRKKRTEDKKEDKKCGNIKKLMEDKLDELRDLESQLASLAKEEASRQVKNVLAGTKSGDLLILIENGKKEYERLEALYEKCIADFSMPKATLLFLHKPQEKKILLAMKKRDFGKGKWNGVGGKLNEGESLKDALVREAHEEIGVKINPDDLAQMATLDFSFKDNQKWNQKTHVFFTEKWEGDPVETEEMSPKWHSVSSLPYEDMWVDDIHWLPLVLEGKKINASFKFNKTGDTILNMKINQI